MSVNGHGRVGALGSRAIRLARLSPDLVRAMALVAEPSRLARGELAELPVALPYRLRGSKLQIYVRHTRSDLRELSRALKLLKAIPPPLARRLSEQPARLIDAGPGLGYFAVGSLAAELVTELVSYEPDPIRAVLLRRCRRANELERVWRIVEASPAARPSERRLAIDSIGSQPIGGRGMRSAVVRATDLLGDLRPGTILRLGGRSEDRQIIDDPRFIAAGVGAVVFDAPPESALPAVAALIDAGYSTSTGPCGAVWGWRPEAAEAP